jgi:hypothetical protein
MERMLRDLVPLDRRSRTAVIVIDVSGQSAAVGDPSPLSKTAKKKKSAKKPRASAKPKLPRNKKAEAAKSAKGAKGRVKKTKNRSAEGAKKRPKKRKKSARRWSVQSRSFSGYFSLPRDDKKEASYAFARKATRTGRLICPTGYLVIWLSSPDSKNSSLPALPKSILKLSPSRPTEGRFAIVTNVGSGMRWTRQRWARKVMAGRVDEACERSNGALTDGADCGRRSRVVLTPRRWRQGGGGASAQPGWDAPYPLATVANKPGHRGEHEGNR